MSLKSSITEDMKNALRAHESLKLNTLRMALSEIKQKEIDTRTDGAPREPSDEDVLAVLNKMIKQRKDSASQYAAAKRQDLADSENAEIEFLKAYLPAQMSDEEIDAAIEKAIAESGATGMAAMGKIMAALKPQLNGKADMSKVSKKVKEALK